MNINDFKMRLFILLSIIVNKIASYKTYTNKLCSRFVENRSVPYSLTYGTNFSQNASPVVSSWGSFLKTYVYATRSSNFSAGDITNELFATITISDDTTIEEWRNCGYYNTTLGAGSGGGLKSYVNTYGANTEGYIRRLYVCSVATADKAAHFHTGPIPMRYPSLFEV